MSEEFIRSEYTIPQDALKHIVSEGSSRSINNLNSASELDPISEVTSPKLGAVKNLA